MRFSRGVTTQKTDIRIKLCTTSHLYRFIKSLPMYTRIHWKIQTLSTGKERLNMIQLHDTTHKLYYQQLAFNSHKMFGGESICVLRKHNYLCSNITIIINEKSAKCKWNYRRMDWSYEEKSFAVKNVCKQRRSEWISQNIWITIHYHLNSYNYFLW